MSVAAPDRTAGVGLTAEQEEAVERRRGALLLAANAGSGKTAVLVERFVRAVHEDGVAPGRILAITFTERAAGELRERVRGGLRELGDRRGAFDSQDAFISTIHGFCARLLRSHPLAAGLAPGFVVLDEGTAAELREEAFERAMAAWLMDGPALDLAAACGVDGLATAIESVHDELRSRGRTRPELPAGRARRDPAAARMALVAAGAALAAALGGAGGGQECGRAREVLAGLALGREPIRLGELKFRRGAKLLSTPEAEAFEAARVRCCEAEADAAGADVLAALGRLLDGFAREFEALKAARGALDFDDLELRARDLLGGDAAVRRRWSERFDLLMVDELQDTNAREMAILAALDRGNLFTVGDEFQSIYGFRHADVGIFRSRRRELEGVDGVRALSRNFRTRPALLGSINAVFAPIFGADFVPLVPGREDGPEGPLLELMVNDSAGWEDTVVGDEPGAGPAWRRAEAGLLAERIAELIDEGGVAGPGEIVVLLRYATAAGVYERALAERGVPVTAAPAGGFYAAQEIADLGAYVSALANPLDDLALFGVLASPLGGVGADGLAILARAARALDRAPWEVLDAAAAGEPAARAGLAPIDGEERERLEAAHALIVGERRAGARVGPAELLVRSGYAERAFGGPGAGLGAANVQKLLRLAREFEAREGRDLRRFADRLEARRLGSRREPDAQLAATEAVRLMTIHAAKGLEFPVVCLADLGHGPPNGLPVILTDGERIGLRAPTLAATRPEAFDYAELRARRDVRAVAEEQRIAYVGMTRARERLILSGSAHFARWPAAGPAAATIAWLGPAVVPDLRARLAGPTGVCEVELGGAPMRLTLTGAPEDGELTFTRLPVDGELTVTGLPADGERTSTAVPGEWVEAPAAGPVDARGPAAAARISPFEPGAATSAPAQISLFDPGPGGWEAPAGPPSNPLAAAIPAGSSASGPEPIRVASPAPVAAVTPDAWSTPPPEAVSYSSLADHARCGYGYYLRRVVGLPEVTPPVSGERERPDPVGERAAGAERGRIVHALLEGVDFARPEPPDETAVRGLSGSREPDPEEVAAVAGLVGAFARSPLCPRLAVAGAVTREASFAIPVGGVMVGGYIDVLARERDGGILIVDYKTDRIDEDADLAARVAADYEIQQRIYALAGLRTGAPTVEVAYCFLRRPDEVVSRRWAAGDAGELERELSRVAAPLLAGRFPVSPRPHRGLCATCPGRARLCSWGEEMTLREQAGMHDD